MLYTDLLELKHILEIDLNDTQEDLKLAFLIEWASALIDQWLGFADVGGIDKQERAEFYGGTNTNKLVLNIRPAFADPVPQVFLDGQGGYGAISGSFGPETKLIYGDDFSLAIDKPDGSSQSAILYKKNGVWPRNLYRSAGLLASYTGPSPGTIRVVYTAGYTPDSIPSAFRVAGNFMVARLRYMMPLGMELNSEGYEERSIGVATDAKDYMLGVIKPLLWQYRNWAISAV